MFNNANPAPSPITLPVIDISSASSETGHDLIKALVTYGFVYVNPSGTSFNADMVDRIFRLVSFSRDDLRL